MKSEEKSSLPLLLFFIILYILLSMGFDRVADVFCQSYIK